MNLCRARFPAAYGKARQRNRHVDEPDLLAAPKMIVHLRDRGDARGGVLEGNLDVFRVGVAGLDAKQSNDRCETVLDAVAHLPRQHGLVVEGGLKFRIGVLPLDGDAEQSGEARQEIGVRRIELTGIGTIDFQHAERQMAFAAPRDENIDRAPDPVVRQKLRCPEACLLFEMVGNHYLPGVKRITGRRFQIGSQRNMIDASGVPADARTDEKPFLVRHIFQHFGERSIQALGAEFGGALQDLTDVAGL